MKNRDFRSADRDKTLNSGTVPAKPGRMVGLPIMLNLCIKADVEPIIFLIVLKNNTRFDASCHTEQVCKSGIHFCFEETNKCLFLFSVCARGRWVCTKNVCDSVCKAVGNHFQTFDGKNFDFDGRCNYILARSEGMQDIAFEVQLINTCTYVKLKIIIDFVFMIALL